MSKKTRNIIIALVVFAVLLVGVLLIYNANKPGAQTAKQDEVTAAAAKEEPVEEAAPAAEEAAEPEAESAEAEAAPAEDAAPAEAAAEPEAESADAEAAPAEEAASAEAAAEQQAEKTIVVTVVHKDGTSKDFTISTKAETLREACEEQDLIAGEESSFGLYLLTVDGETVDEANQEWWCITKGGTMTDTGVDGIIIADGDAYEFTLTVGW